MATPPIKQQRRLGRGLSSLIGLSDAAVTTPDVDGPVSTLTDDVDTEAPTAEIRPNPHQPRRTFDDASLAELAASIRSSGVIQPLVVKRLPDGFELIAGERRLRAAKLAGLASVPVVVREVDAVAQAQLALVENVQREDLNPIDRAQGYRSLIDQLNLTQAELAGRLGEERSGIANYLRLLDLDPGVQETVRAGALSLGHAKLLAGVSDNARQLQLAELIITDGLSVRALEAILRQDAERTPAAEASLATPSAYVAEVERALSSQLGFRVQVKSNQGGRGRVVIHYKSLDQFDELLGRLNVKLEPA